ncbi:hypothetical protein [Flavobacterium plantiphilum]|uniref:hypothetical protein n=1 Tax=Flavobacterium plantiphilum TaxID=3163297 RepID=UPI0038B60DE3
MGLGKEVLAVDSEYFMPTEVVLLIGDTTNKAKTKLGCQPKYDLAGLMKEMQAMI